MPEFLKKQKELSGAEKGTLMHLCLQKLDEKVDYNLEKIEDMIANLKMQKIISEKEEKEVDIKKIYNFTKTNIWKEMQNAKEIQKEKPFYISIPAKEIYEEDIEDEVLVQGIIDLYYLTKEDELVLVDYKTDKVNNKEELIKKYSGQLKVYKEALEKSLNRKVDRTYIYSTYLEKEIRLDL